MPLRIAEAQCREKPSGRGGSVSSVATVDKRTGGPYGDGEAAAVQPGVVMTRQSPRTGVDQPQLVTCSVPGSRSAAVVWKPSELIPVSRIRSGHPAWARGEAEDDPRRVEGPALA